MEKKRIIIGCLVVALIGIGAFWYINRNGGTTSLREDIAVTTPRAGDSVLSPIAVEGSATGNWFFEANIVLQVLDANGVHIGQGFGTAEGEWMTEEMVPFKGSVTYSIPETATGMLRVHNDNASGLPEHDKWIDVPIQFGDYGQETMAIMVHFVNTLTDPERLDCSVTHPVQRTIPKTQAVARAALDALFMGPTNEEKQEGYVSDNNLSSRVRIKSLTVTNGVANVDFSEELEEGLGGSCRVSSLKAQITNTLKQFSSVREVIISVDGRTEDVLQP